MRLPVYQITSLLGRGGMGAVYKGCQINLDRPVAIKILPSFMDDDETGGNFSARFKNEARAMARLSHAGIVKAFDFGETADGLLYIVMEFIEGTDVAQMLHEQGRLPPVHALAITAHVCDALTYAHSRGIYHRDIKPANIMVGYDGVVKVADFGLAKMSHDGKAGLTQSGLALGTLHYMAPEALVLGAGVDHRADLYSLGVMLYQMLTGSLPQGIFKMPSQLVPGLDPRYDAIISKALREDRDIRHQSAAEFRAELDALLTQPVVKVQAGAAKAEPALPTTARPRRPAEPGFRPPPSKVEVRVKKSGSPLLWAAVIAMGGLITWLSWNKPLPANDTRQTESAVVENTASTTLAPKPAPTSPPSAAPVKPTAPAAPAPPTPVITSTAPAPSNPSESWTDQTGRQMTAKFVRLKPDRVTLSIQGQEMDFLLSRLSAESQKQAQALAQAAGRAVPASPVASTLLSSPTPSTAPRTGIMPAAGASLPTSATAPQTWTDTKGRKITASLVRLQGGQITLKVQGRDVTFAVASLSADSQKLAESLSRAASMPGSAAPGSMNAATLSEQNVIARFTFDGTTPEPGAQIKNAEQKDGVLELSGDYENRNPPGYRAVFSTPDLNYNHFTAAIRLRPERVNDVLLVGGTSYRWLSVRWTSTSNLTFHLNNQRFSEVIRGVRVLENKWLTLAVSCDLDARQAVVYLDGKKEATIQLPDDLKLDVVGTNSEQSDKVWAVTNYSNGNAFKGQVDELVIFGRVLSDAEIKALRLGQPAPATTPASDEALVIESVTPVSPARLKPGERLTVKVRYTNTESDSVQIWARPYTKGVKSPGYGAHGSSIYPKGKGQIEGWFTFQKSTEVDEVRVQMVDQQTGRVLSEAKLPVQASW
jgi:serine/threonine protein kinase